MNVNVNDSNVDVILENESDFCIVMTLKNENGSCVDVILGNVSEFCIGVILVNGNDLGMDESRID